METEEKLSTFSMVWCESVEAQETNFDGNWATFHAYAIGFSSLRIMYLCVIYRNSVYIYHPIQSNFLSNVPHSFMTMKQRSLRIQCSSRSLWARFMFIMHRMDRCEKNPICQRKFMTHKSTLQSCFFPRGFFFHL